MDIEQHILNLINEIGDIDSTTHLNERYLHHLFSHRIQQDYPLSLDYHSKLPPEWATNVYRNKNRGLYQRVNGHYQVAGPEGSSGFIDFAIGHADEPDVAIEFKMSTHFNKEGIIYDYMKLLDARNHIRKAISVVVYYGHSSHSKNCKTEELNKCMKEAKQRLGTYLEQKRAQWFIFMEIINGGVTTRFDCSDLQDFRIQ
ncbi:MAG: hypothetical protein J6Y32_01485 [Bacteroidales bacterium]|nr:hypothetical protein [Bacteroidales bacterium]